MHLTPFTDTWWQHEQVRWKRESAKNNSYLIKIVFAIVLFLCVSVCHVDSIHIGEEVSWLKVNTDMTGYYVVHYEDGGWDKMIKLLRENHTAVSYKDRIHLIHNAFQLVT